MPLKTNLNVPCGWPRNRTCGPKRASRPLPTSASMIGDAAFEVLLAPGPAAAQWGLGVEPPDPPDVRGRPPRPSVGTSGSSRTSRPPRRPGPRRVGWSGPREFAGPTKARKTFPAAAAARLPFASISARWFARAGPVPGRVSSSCRWSRRCRPPRGTSSVAARCRRGDAAPLVTVRVGARPLVRGRRPGFVGLVATAATAATAAARIARAWYAPSTRISTSNFSRSSPLSSSGAKTSWNGNSNCSSSHRVQPDGIDPP